MLTEEIMPLSVPASSPWLREISLFFVIVFLLRIFTLPEHVEPLACEHWAMFGKGAGAKGAGGAGILQTSSGPGRVHMPPPFVDAANTSLLLREVDPLALDLHSVARLEQRVLADELDGLLSDHPQPAGARLRETLRL